jgi:hypothetical protein
MMIPHVFINITGEPWNTIYISTSSGIILVCLYPANTPYRVHSSPLLSLVFPLNPPYIIPYHWFRAERDLQKPSSQDLQ